MATEKNNFFCFTVDDVCYEGYSSEKHLENIIEFCDEKNIKSTFFVVPLANEKPLSSRRSYINILKAAIKEGHEVAQHGLRHDRFEVGIPPEMVMSLPHEGPAREYLKNNREEIEKSHTVDAIRKTLTEGRKMLEDALQMEIKGFRAPALQSCDNLFHALDAEKYLYDSSTFLQKAAWDLLNGKECVPRPINREKYDNFQYNGKLKEVPLTAEYTWYLKQKDFDVSLSLAIHDFNACMEAQIPFVPICHVSPVQEGDDDLGFDFYNKLIDHAVRYSQEKNINIGLEVLSGICSKI